MKKIKLIKIFFKKVSNIRLKNEHLDVLFSIFFYFLKSFCRHKKIRKKFLGNFFKDFVEFDINHLLLGKELLFISLLFLPGILQVQKIPESKNDQGVLFFNKNIIKKKLILYLSFFFQILNREKIKSLKKFFLIIGKKVFSLGFGEILFFIFSPGITLNFLKKYQSISTTFHSLEFLEIFYIGLRRHQRPKFLGEILRLGKFFKGNTVDSLFYRFFLGIFYGISKKKTILISEKIYFSLKKTFQQKLMEIPEFVNFAVLRTLKFLLTFLMGNFPKKVNFLFNLKIFSFLGDFSVILVKKGFSFQELETFLNFSGHLSNHNSKNNKNLLVGLIINFLNKQKTKFFKTSPLSKTPFITIEKMLFLKNQKFLNKNQVKNCIILKNVSKKLSKKSKLKIQGDIITRYFNVKLYLFSGSSLKNF